MAVETGRQIGVETQKAEGQPGSSNGTSRIAAENAGFIANHATFYEGRSLGMVEVTLARKGMDPVDRFEVVSAIASARTEIASARDGNEGKPQSK